jgi:hypothetical protein
MVSERPGRPVPAYLGAAGTAGKGGGRLFHAQEPAAAGTLRHMLPLTPT